MISVDWSQVDPSYEYTRGIPFYWKSIELMPSMAQHIKEFLEKLDVSPASLHLVGYSLGCHISGFVGKAMAGKVGENLYRPFIGHIKTNFWPQFTGFIHLK